MEKRRPGSNSFVGEIERQVRARLPGLMKVRICGMCTWVAWAEVMAKREQHV